MTLTEFDRRTLLALARESIDAGLELHGSAPFAPPSLAPTLLECRSAFVTLRVDGDLRGCCGSIEATRPLAEEVWRNAQASAFADPRFAPLTRTEWHRTHVHISVLEVPQPILVASEQALLSQLRPGIDGLILELGSSRATFLPSVWEDLRDPQSFVRHLKAKAGWSADFWSPQIRVARYGAEGFGE